MGSEYGQWYEEFKNDFDNLGENELSGAMNRLIFGAASTISMNRKLMAKTIDVSWVEAIENGIIHVDNCIRRPGKTIIDVEEIVPIALSKKITVESVKHLAQHTNLIQSIDPVTGQITPSHLLNVHKEESLATYENRFLNTLIDRLYIFIITRYERLSQVSKDEEVFTLDFDTSLDDGNGGSMQVKLSIDSTRSLETRNDQGMTIWQRVEKLKKTIEGYKGCELCRTLGNDFVRPPIMRTNAIMKNVDLRACLTLWQYILSYDKTGYEINVEDTVLKPDKDYMNDLKRLTACNLLLFRSYVDDNADSITVMGQKKLKPIAPKVVRRYGRELLSGNFDIHAEEAVGYLSEDGEQAFVKTVPENTDEIFEQINLAIEIERNYYKEREKERLEKIAAEEEAERRRQEREARLEEKRRIEEAKRKERERIKREKEEEERRIKEMLERKRLEIEAEERERARQEAERLARLEEERRIEEEARQKRAEEARIAAERERIARQKQDMRNELGGALGINVEIIDRVRNEQESQQAYSNITNEDLEEAATAIENIKQVIEAQEIDENAGAEGLQASGEQAVNVGEDGKTDTAADGRQTVRDGAAEADQEIKSETEKIMDAISESFLEEKEGLTREEIAVAAKAVEEENENDPRVIAAKIKLDQQKREIERKEAERAARLKAERQILENKPFDVIRKQYSYNPIYLIPRIIMKLLFVLFGYIPKDTDNPDLKRILATRAEKKKHLEELSEGREKMEVYYRKYAPDTKYRVRRDIDDIKFKRKKRKQAKNAPRPTYVPPKRTPEEQAAINKQMKKYYKEYHVSIFKRIFRWMKAQTKAEKEREFKRALGEK